MNQTDITELEHHMENHVRAFELLQKAIQRLMKAKLAHMYSHNEKILHYNDGEKANKSLYALFDVTIKEFEDAKTALIAAQNDFAEASSKVDALVVTVSHYDPTEGFDNK